MRGIKREWAGVVQGSLTILKAVGKDKHGNILWLCRCECGKEVQKPNRTLAGGVKTCSPACGVSASNRQRAQHGRCHTKEYVLWGGIKQRCFNPTHARYDRYGGRGITMHPDWADSFEAFFAYVGPAPTQDGDTSMDRIDNELGYEPGNVRWATRRVQANNTSQNVRTEFRGKDMTVAEIARAVDIPYHQVGQRFRRGLRGEDLVRKHRIGRPPKKGSVT